ncbi:MAG: HNH endonuclease [Xanthomonadales bacterium]|nr:HNH endonuclease [Xanthomonadales bacterium]
MSSKFYVGVTDSRWFRYLAARTPDEVNFWMPSPKVGFRALPEGGLFLFKLHHPENFVVGGGFFVRYTRLPLMLAWDAFGAKNGVDSQHAFLTSLRRFRRDAHPSQDVGCVILAAPFFFPREQWIQAPESFAKNIVRGKVYDPQTEDGCALLAAVRERMNAIGETDELLDTETEPERPLRLILGRLGQGAFRTLVTDAYTRRCAISGERTLPALEAAHIKPYAESGPNRTENGLLLRSDLHRLFDAGYVTVTPERRIEVSRRIKEEFENGRDYYRFHGEKLVVEPGNPAEKPDSGYLGWHNERIFRA